MRFFKRPLRVLAVMGKEVVEVLRRPQALVSIVAGPVIILGCSASATWASHRCAPSS